MQSREESDAFATFPLRPSEAAPLPRYTAKWSGVIRTQPAARVAALIRVDAVWLATEPIDLRADTQTALARVVKMYGSTDPHHAYLFANRRAKRIKSLLHDCIGIWRCAAQVGCIKAATTTLSFCTWMAMTREQHDSLVLVLPWQRIGAAAVITAL